MKKSSTLLSVTLLTALMTGTAQTDKAKPIKLFNGKDLSGWEFFLNDPKAKMADVWSVKDGVIACKGKPMGYICTEKKYENFKLTVEYRWPKGAKPGNSGVFLRISGKPMFLPKCAEAQLLHGSAGDMYGFQNFVIDGKGLSKNPNAVGGLRALKKVAGNEQEPGEWNKMEITATGENITVVLNGKQVNEATGCDALAGKVGLQSEGGAIEFRNVLLTPLK